jgi:hypothetical protein
VPADAELLTNRPTIRGKRRIRKPRWPGNEKASIRREAGLDIAE